MGSNPANVRQRYDTKNEIVWPSDPVSHAPTRKSNSPFGPPHSDRALTNKHTLKLASNRLCGPMDKASAYGVGDLQVRVAAEAHVLPLERYAKNREFCSAEPHSLARAHTELE